MATKKQKSISRNISKFRKENIPQKQAVAKAISIEKQKRKKRKK